MSYKVIACPRCNQFQIAESRHESKTCLGCGNRFGMRQRTPLWEGESAESARGALVTLTRKGEISVEPREVRHDSPLSAVSAQVREIRSLPAKADAVAQWCGRILGEFSEEQLLQALQDSGFSKERSEKEMVRLLATDIIFEPKPGVFAYL